MDLLKDYQVAGQLLDSADWRDNALLGSSRLVWSLKQANRGWDSSWLASRIIAHRAKLGLGSLYTEDHESRKAELLLQYTDFAMELDVHGSELYVGHDYDEAVKTGRTLLSSCDWLYAKYHHNGTAEPRVWLHAKDPEAWAMLQRPELQARQKQAFCYHVFMHDVDLYAPVHKAKGFSKSFGNGEFDVSSTNFWWGLKPDAWIKLLARPMSDQSPVPINPVLLAFTQKELSALGELLYRLLAFILTNDVDGGLSADVNAVFFAIMPLVCTDNVMDAYQCYYKLMAEFTGGIE